MKAAPCWLVLETYSTPGAPQGGRCSGVASWVSPSRTLAPGSGAISATIGTTFWGSSARGGSSTAKTPSRIEATTMSGVSLLCRNVRASRPARPRCSASIGHLDRVPVPQLAGPLHQALICCHACANPCRIAVLLADGEPAELRVSFANHDHAGQVAPLDQRRARDPQPPGARAGRKLQAREVARPHGGSRDHQGPQRTAG